MSRLHRIFLILTLILFVPPIKAQGPFQKIGGVQHDSGKMRAVREENDDVKFRRQVRFSYGKIYEPLFDAISVLSQSKYPAQYAFYSSPLIDSINFLKQSSIQQGNALVHDWIIHFRGIESSFESSEENPGIDYRVESRLSTGVMFFEMIKFAENRIALAHNNHEIFLNNLEDSLKFREAFFLLDWRKGSGLLLPTRKTPSVYAQALKSFTTGECNRLLRLIERWESGNGVWKVGLKNRQRTELRRALGNVPDNGQIEVIGFGDRPENQPKNVQRFEEKLMGEQSGYEIDLILRQVGNQSRLHKQRSQTPNAEAIRRKRILIASILRDYQQIVQLIINPFLRVPDRSDLPDWIDQTNELSLMNNFVVDQMTLQEERLSLQLLAVHTEIRKFRWEHDRLPYTLAELEIKNRIIDQITHQPFHYETDGDSYLLTGSMPMTLDEEGGFVIPSGEFDLMKGSLPYEASARKRAIIR